MGHLICNKNALRRILIELEEFHEWHGGARPWLRAQLVKASVHNFWWQTGELMEWPRPINEKKNQKNLWRHGIAQRALSSLFRYRFFFISNENLSFHPLPKAYLGRLALGTFSMGHSLFRTYCAIPKDSLNAYCGHLRKKLWGFTALCIIFVAFWLVTSRRSFQPLRRFSLKQRSKVVVGRL